MRAMLMLLLRVLIVLCFLMSVAPFALAYVWESWVFFWLGVAASAIMALMTPIARRDWKGPP